MEIWEDALVELIFDYCLSRNYEEEYPPFNFPLDYYFKQYFIHLIALEKNEVLEMLNYWESQLRNKDIPLDETKMDTQMFISICRTNKGRFLFDKNSPVL